jgi:hypothetical protein
LEARNGLSQELDFTTKTQRTRRFEAQDFT